MALLGAAVAWAPGCRHEAREPTRGEAALATVQVVRPEVRLEVGGKTRLAGWETRVAPGTTVRASSGRAWLRHDRGVAALLEKDAAVRVDVEGITVLAGRAWIEAPPGPASAIRVGDALLSASGAGFEVALRGAEVRLYAARGHVEVQRGDSRVEVAAGDEAVLAAGTLRVAPRELWEDWTGGLAWPSPDLPQAPSGMGEVGARIPGSLGKASFPLATRSLSVQATVSRDLVTTVVDQVFFNPASEDLEGVYRVRVPEGATLESFCIDRPGFTGVACGFVKEKKAARTQYRQQVYVGSRDDPALLEWEAPGQYKAHLYPIKAGATRRVVIVYSEWLERDGEVRRWRYPMAPAGGVGPRIQELELKVNLVESGAKRVEAAMGAVVEDDQVLLRRSDFQPRADFVLALHGGGVTGPARGYRGAKTDAEGRYFMARVRPKELLGEGGREGLDLVVVVDLSADTDPSEQQLARTVVESLLRQLGAGDRVAVLGADLTVYDPSGGKPALKPISPALVETVLEGLARRGVGGATDLGTVLSGAADLLVEGRGGAVVYVGDGVPTVGEMDARSLRLRLRRRATPVRLYGVAVGSEANLQLLATLAGYQGGLALRVDDRASAAAAALRVAGHASRPVMSEVEVDLGPSVERVFPAEPVSVVAGRDLVILGRLRGPVPETVQLRGWFQGRRIDGAAGTYRLTTVDVEDRGRLRRGWGTARLGQLIAGGAGREEVAELGTRFALVTEHTSLYVPSAREVATDQSIAKNAELARAQYRQTVEDAKVKERQRAEEGRQRASSGKRYAPKGTSAGEVRNETKDVSTVPTLKESAKQEKPRADRAGGDGEADQKPRDEVKVDERVKSMGSGPAGGKDTGAASSATRGRGMLGVISNSDKIRDEPFGDTARREPAAPPPPKTAPPAESAPIRGEAESRGWGDFGKGGGGGGGGGVGIGGGGFGIGKYKSDKPVVFMSRATVTGGLDAATIRRVIRRHLQEVHYCYASVGLSANPRLAGMIKVSFTITPPGLVGQARVSTTTLNHGPTEACVTSAVRRWRFPKPEGATPFVVYPFHFKPGERASEPVASRHRIDVHVHVTPPPKPHVPKHCSAASQQPLEARAVLWRERLRGKGTVFGAAEVWADANLHCEVPRWRDRRTLLGLVLDRLGSIAQMTDFVTRYRRLLGSGERAYLERMIFARIRTAADLRLANRAFRPGAELDWRDVERLLARQKDDAGRVRLLHELAGRYPRHVGLQLHLLALLERTGRHGAAERLCGGVVGNPWADARLRTAAGEYWARRGDPDRAKRIFSEMVEFRPADPLARRRLGDLYRSFGWFEEAYRQYQTLAALLPHDSSALLLMALAAAGTGRVNEALRLEARVAAAATGSGGAARWARLWAALQLAELREAARARKDTAALAALDALGQRLGAAQDARPLRVLLTFTHPEADLELWMARPGAAAPRGGRRDGALAFERAAELAPQFGLEALPVRALSAGTYTVEVRRVGDHRNRTLQATLWVLWDEGRATERLVSIPLTLAPGAPAARVTVTGREAVLQK